MTERAPSSPSSGRWYVLLQPSDIAWAFFVFVLLITAPEQNNQALILVPLIGVFQILEPRFTLFQSQRGQVASVALKLVLSYLLIGFSHPLYSYYSPILLVPVVSAATLFEWPGVLAVNILAAAAPASFLLPAFGPWETLPPGVVSDLLLRISFYAMIGFIVFQQARAKRAEMARTQDALENLRLAEASLRRSERLAALGQLTAGLAHELRNPLGTIKASAEMLTGTMAQAQPEIRAEMAGFILSEVDRINGLVASFLDFARPLRMKPTVSFLRPLLDEIVRQQADLVLDRQVTVEVEDDEDQLAFAFDPELLRVSISNLLQNAIQASPAGERVVLRALSKDESVLILVADHGEGIQPQHLESIFNPFFTTKPHGVGLGLALVSKIVDEHGGKINVFSEPGKGTTFEILLPKRQAL